MIGKRILRSLFPPPRRRVRLVDAIPLVLFLVAFVGTCLYLELTHKLLFARPSAFALLAITPWMWWLSFAGYAGLSRARSIVALETRLLLVGLFVVLMADPRAVRTSDELSVVYALDVSDSIGDLSSDEALRFVAETVSKKPKPDRAGLIVFGRSAAVELPTTTKVPVADNVLVNSLIDKEATNLEQGLSLAAAMLPEETQGRIVLISDGMQTEGNLARVLDDLKTKGVSVDVIPIQYNFSEEVWLERLELPQFVKIGESYEAGIVLSSLSSGEGTLRLEENGNTIAEQTVKFQAGKSRFSVPIQLRNPGYFEYTATIEVPNGKDSLDKNNKAINSLYLEGEGKVLLVVDREQDNERDWQPIRQALREGKHVVDVMSGFEFPRDSSSLLPYDCIMFVNVPADAFDSVQLQALRDAVYDFGSGFLMVGGPNSFGPGGYHRTVVEEALPVTMDISQKKVLPKGALAIILHTCEFPEGNTWAKRITKQAIKVLGAQDEVGVLIYGPGGEQWVFKLTPAGDYEKLVPKINAAEPGDMPSFANTMRLGLTELRKSDAATKHMIIISDGDPVPAPPSLIQDYVDEKISVSTVAIFPHGGNEIGLLRTVANATGGRYYFPSDPEQLPAIFIKESKTLKRSMIQNKTITPEVGMDDQSILKGIEGTPPLKGYVITTPKPKPAMTVLQVPSEQSEEEGDIDPILAITRYGLGQTAAFTSDLSPNWAAQWMDWDHYATFVQQLTTRIARVRKEGHLRMWTYTSGNEGVVVVEDFHAQEQFLEIQAAISGPRDRVERVTLKQVGPRRYQASMPLWGKGRYHAVARPVTGERSDERAFGGFIISYSPEYLRFRSNPLVLNDISEKTGGMALDRSSTAEDIFQTRRVPKRTSREIFDWFLMALAILVPLDVGVRRIQIDWGAIKMALGLGRRVTASTETMGALLERKQAVDSQIEARRGETSIFFPDEPRKPTASPPRRPVTAPNPAAPAPAPAPKTDDLDSTTTTERLLKLKRKRQDDKP